MHHIPEQYIGPHHRFVCFLLVSSAWNQTNNRRLVIATADTKLSRRYEVDIGEWFVPLNVYTMEVDYADAAVQVRSLQKKVFIASALKMIVYQTTINGR